MVGDVSFRVADAPLHRGVVAKHRPDRFAQCLVAIQYEHVPLLRVDLLARLSRRAVRSRQSRSGSIPPTAPAGSSRPLVIPRHTLWMALFQRDPVAHQHRQLGHRPSGWAINSTKAIAGALPKRPRDRGLRTATGPPAQSQCRPAHPCPHTGESNPTQASAPTPRDNGSRHAKCAYVNKPTSPVPSVAHTRGRSTRDPPAAKGHLTRLVTVTDCTAL